VTEAERQYYDMMDSLFVMPGWKLLKDDIQGWLEAIASQWQALTPDNLRFEQGRYSGLEQVAKHFQTLEGLKAHALADADISLEGAE
jgi:hypothetical protein